MCRNLHSVKNTKEQRLLRSHQPNSLLLEIVFLQGFCFFYLIQFSSSLVYYRRIRAFCVINSCRGFFLQIYGDILKMHLFNEQVFVSNVLFNFALIQLFLSSSSLSNITNYSNKCLQIMLPMKCLTYAAVFFVGFLHSNYT